MLRQTLWTLLPLLCGLVNAEMATTTTLTRVMPARAAIRAGGDSDRTGGPSHGSRRGLIHGWRRVGRSGRTELQRNREDDHPNLAGRTTFSRPVWVDGKFTNRAPQIHDSGWRGPIICSLFSESLLCPKRGD
jgi:hypothetical protein